MNKVFLTGNLTRNPEVRYFPDGTAVANFGVAMNERWSDRETGEQRETVCFVDVEAWGRQAELMHEYFKKGNGILIEGTLKFDAWKADDGTNRNRLKVRLQRFEFMGSPGENTEQADDTEQAENTEKPDDAQQSDNAEQAPQVNKTADENVPF